MNFTVHDMPQKSPEWYAIRAGLLTGSCVDAVIARRKNGSGELAVRATLRKRLVVERITGRPVDDITHLPQHMQRGETFESAAFMAYEVQTGVPVRQVGFVSHLTLKTGCSPDGYIGNWLGLVEFKCPKSITHLDYLTTPETLRAEYFAQALHAIWLTGAEFCDLCSFDDRFPSGMELVRVRIKREDLDLDAYSLAVSLFLSEVDAEVEKVMALAHAGAAA